MRWWILVCLEILIIAIAIFFGFHTVLESSDQTRLSFVIAATWAVVTIAIGRWHFLADTEHIRNSAKVGWFAAEACLALGMLGTVMGFLMMLGTAFASINVSDTGTLQTALTTMALGMATALYTTLTGIVANLFLKIQLVNLENMADNNGQP
jgi:hypothetical protein